MCHSNLVTEYFLASVTAILADILLWKEPEERKDRAANKLSSGLLPHHVVGQSAVVGEGRRSFGPESSRFL